MPYTDLLVNDMDPNLDNRVAENGLTESQGWRTSPLWGIGLTKRANDYAGFLHDSRTRSIGRGNLMAWDEAEFSRHAYKALSRREKHDLLEWLNQL